MTKLINFFSIVLLLTPNYPDTFSITHPLKSTFFAVEIRWKGFLTNGEAILRVIMNVVKIRWLTCSDGVLVGGNLMDRTICQPIGSQREQRGGLRFQCQFQRKALIVRTDIRRWLYRYQNKSNNKYWRQRRAVNKDSLDNSDKENNKEKKKQQQEMTPHTTEAVLALEAKLKDIQKEKDLVGEKMKTMKIMNISNWSLILIWQTPWATNQIVLLFVY